MLRSEKNLPLMAKNEKTLAYLFEKEAESPIIYNLIFISYERRKRKKSTR